MLLNKNCEDVCSRLQFSLRESGRWLEATYVQIASEFQHWSCVLGKCARENCENKIRLQCLKRLDVSASLCFVQHNIKDA